MISIITFIIIGLFGMVEFEWTIIFKRHSYIIHYGGYILTPLHNFLASILGKDERFDILSYEKVKNDVNFKLNPEYSLEDSSEDDYDFY